MTRPHWDSFEWDDETKKNGASFPRQGRRLGANLHRLAVEAKQEEKEMKRQFAKLSKAGQQKVESDYHRMKPEEFDTVMSRAKPHSPNAILLSPRLVKRLKTVAESQGEPEYQAMVKRWVEERLQQASKSVS